MVATNERVRGRKGGALSTPKLPHEEKDSRGSHMGPNPKSISALRRIMKIYVKICTIKLKLWILQ